MSVTRHSPRLTAALTGRHTVSREIGPETAHERNVLAITRRIHTLTRQLAALRAEHERGRRALRDARRELRLVLQRDSRITDDRLETAGQADATDRAIALAERRK